MIMVNFKLNYCIYTEEFMKITRYMLLIFMTSFLFLSTAQADATCYYKNNDITFECKVTNSSVSCSTKEATAGSPKVSISASEYLDSNNEINCGLVSQIYVDGFMYNGKLYYYDINNNNVCPKGKEEYDKIKEPGTPENKGECIAFAGTTASKPNTNPSTSSKPSTNTPSTKPTTNNETTSSPTGFDREHFCEGTVLKVFRAVGYIFFMLKIIIPVVIMIFGFIDFGKAVIASKDDEIKKSAKTLAFRAIAGIIIFFIPAIINFAVTLIGGEDVYRGSEFGACTECLIDPNTAACQIGD